MTKNRTILLMMCLICAVGIVVSGNQSEAALWDALDPFVIPLHPALKKISDQKMLVNGQEIKIILLLGEEVSMASVIDYYKRMFVQKGWQMKEEQPTLSGGVTLRFSRDTSIISLDALSGDIVQAGSNTLMVRVAQVQVGDDRSQQVLEAMRSQKDMPGEDITWLKRYPDSIRLQSLRVLETDFMSVQYKVPASSCIQCVADFYSEQMSNQGWKLLTTTTKTHDELKLDERIENSVVARITAMQQEQERPLPVNYSAEQIKEMMSSRLPDTVTTLIFQKKDTALCLITVAYISERRQAGQGFAERYQQQLSELMQKKNSGAAPDSNQAQLIAELFNSGVQGLANEQLQHFQERIEIGIQYMPKSMLQARSN